MPGVGDKLGRYTLLKRLAVGGMGEVFVAAKAGPVGFGPLVALKVLRDELAVDPQFVDMIVDEANITRHLNHQNLVSVLDLGEQDGSYYIAMEYVQGITAERLIEALVERGQRLDVPLALHIGIELCRALKYAHSRTNEAGESLGIIHRDVTPANILLSTEGEVKLTDFGIARAKGRVHQTQAGVLKGKFGYMAPEMVRYEDLDARADLFCAGVALYLLAAGQHPVAHASVMEAIQRYENKRIARPSEINPAITPELDAVLLKALEPRPDARWQTAAEMGEALQGILLGHAEWRTWARGMSAMLARRVREVAPEVFGEVVPRETLERLSSETSIPALAPPPTPVRPRASSAGDRSSDDEEETAGQPPGVGSSPTHSTPAVREAVLRRESSTDPRHSPRTDYALDEPALPEAVAGGRAGQTAGRDPSEQDRTVAGFDWSEPAIERTLADAEEDDGETIVGVALGEVDGAPFDEESYGITPDAPTIIPLEAEGPSPAENEPDSWSMEADPGQTLLEGLDVASVREAIGRLGSDVPVDRTLADDDAGDESDETYVRALTDPADPAEPVASEAMGSPRVAGPLRIVLGADGAPALASETGASFGSSTPAAADAPGPVSIGGDRGMGAATGRWMKGELGAQALEWSDEAAGRRAVATRNQPFENGRASGNPWGGAPRSAPGPARPSSPAMVAPASGSWLADYGALLGTGLGISALAATFAWLWFMTDLLWPTLVLETEPSGAQVVLDGEPIPGVTPLELTVEPGRRHRIEIRADGFAPELREIAEHVGRWKTYKLEVALNRQPPVLHVGPVAGRALLNGEEVGRGQTIRLRDLPDRGQVEIRVEAPGYQPYEVIFASADEIPLSLDIPLEPSKSR